MSRRARGRIPDRLGFILLGIWLVLTGLVQLLGLSFTGLGIIMGLIALVAGLLILAQGYL